MPIYYDPEDQVWSVNLTKEEFNNIDSLIDYIKEKFSQVHLVLDENNEMNRLLDLRFLDDDTFFNS